MRRGPTPVIFGTRPVQLSKPGFRRWPLAVADDGSIGRMLDQWAYLNGVEIDFSRPGKPTDNAYIAFSQNSNHDRPH